MENNTLHQRITDESIMTILSLEMYWKIFRFIKICLAQAIKLPCRFKHQFSRVLGYLLENTLSIQTVFFDDSERIMDSALLVTT